MDEHIRELAQRVWNYHLMGHHLTKSDVILVLCSHDERVAERAAQLFLEGWAPLIIFSGGQGSITKHLFDEPEADRFARIAHALCVPRVNILIENRSTNTGENIKFTRELLAEKRMDPQSFIVVQKPYMERRSFATFMKLWPEKELVVTSPQVSFEDYMAQYAHGSLLPDDVISIMVGDLQKIKLYPDKGFQIQQDIPADVWDAYEELVQAGYTKYLLSN